MVLGLYGVLYLEVARRPEHGWLVAAAGLTGKILGPAGLAWLIATGAWSAARRGGTAYRSETSGGENGRMHGHGKVGECVVEGSVLMSRVDLTERARLR